MLKSWLWSWISKGRTLAIGIGLLLERAMAWVKTEHKDNGWIKGMCKHHLEGKLEDIALRSRLKFSKGNMIPSTPIPNLRDKPPDPIIPPSIEISGGRRSSSRLAISAKSHKGKDTQSGGKNHQGLVKLNLWDFIPDEIQDRGNIELGLNAASGEVMREAEQNEVGLIYLENGVVLATTQQMEEDPADVAITPVTCNSSIPDSHNVCVMNTNDILPLSPETGMEILDITMLPVDLNPRFDELTSPNSNYPLEVGGNSGNTPANPVPGKINSKHVENVWNRNQHGRPTFDEQMKANNESEETRLKYFPPTITPSGGKEWSSP
ncbi:hypothetical protein L1987_47744 [Smallanthus sonchifolius]|uniref:Uncharacterized protein n=1 Tax=Smallanthus sonchifolius TaxID=185202 RepID=A0ACB9G4I0_9ASTR|nr:hypothetical protein L1987_47744 [Smallanthus sonchifolius]